MENENEDLTAEDLKDYMRGFAMLKANMENWKYVQHNRHLVDRDRLEQTVDQMITTFDGFAEKMQMVLELKALTTFDPHDLI